MISKLLNISFIKDFFFTLREKKVYKTKNKIHYIFDGDMLGIMYNGYMISVNIPNFIEEFTRYISLGDGADYANLTSEERKNLIKHYEEIEDFEKCRLINDIENKLKRRK